MSPYANERDWTYFATGLVVVQVHETSAVALDFARVGEALGERGAGAHVGRASAPLPAGVAAAQRILVGVLGPVAAARMDRATTARLTDRVRHPGAPHGVQVRRLSAAFNLTTFPNNTNSINQPRSVRLNNHSDHLISASNLAARQHSIQLPVLIIITIIQ